MITLPPIKQKLPLYAQIYQYFKDEIRSGTWRAHEKLPSKRRLAEELRVSVNTVTAAYTQLASEGYIYSRPQSGFYVCEIGALVQANVPVSAPSSSLSPSSVQVDFSSHGVEREHFPYACLLYTSVVRKNLVGLVHLLKFLRSAFVSLI